MKKLLTKGIMLPLIVFIAAALVVLKVKTKDPIEHEVLQFPVKAVEVIDVKRIPYRAKATAYGSIEPQVMLNAKSEVGGKITYIHPDLQKGGSLPKETVVVRIEPTTYQFSLDQKEAGLSSSQSSLNQLEVEESSARRSLALAEENLSVQLKELARIKDVWEKKLVARSALDAEEQKVIGLRQQVEDLKGKLAGYSSRKKATQAQINQSKSQVAQGQDTLGRTEISLPFDARIGAVNIEKGEVIGSGAVLFEALGTDAVEITAQIPIKQFRPLLSNLSQSPMDMAKTESFQSAIGQLNLDAQVRLVGDTNGNTHWDAELLRISESVDPTRDTIGLVVSVDKPYEGVIPGERPPLLKGMYSAVTFLAPASEALAIPRKAMHQGRVYIAKDDNTLEIRSVDILFEQGNFVVLKSGIEEGERLVISDVIPVIQGLPLKPLLAEEFAQKFEQDALGVAQ